MKICILSFLLMASCAVAEEPLPLWRQMQQAVLTRPNVAEARKILDAGFDPNGSIGCGDWPAILGAVQLRDVEMTRLLLEKGAKVPDQAMLMACGTSDMELTLIKLLVEHGGNVNAKNGSYSSCMHTATYHKNGELVKFLSKVKGIDLNVVCHDGDCDGTPLMWALRIGATDLAHTLVEAGTNMDIRGKTGATAATIVSDRLRAYEVLRGVIASKGAR